MLLSVPDIGQICNICRAVGRQSSRNDDHHKLQTSLLELLSDQYQQRLRIRIFTNLKIAPNFVNTSKFAEMSYIMKTSQLS